MDFLNANGLVDGRIPPGNPCPFSEICSWRTDNCPTVEGKNLRDQPFSCGAARAISMVFVSKQDKK
jgi:hypothetical protein